MKDGVLGIVSGDPSSSIMRQYPEVRVRGYMNIPDLLDAVVQGDVAGALLDRVTAVNYVTDLYLDQLKIVSPPLDNMGLHFIVEKGQNQKLLASLDQSLQYLKKKKKLKALLQKWSL